MKNLLKMCVLLLGSTLFITGCTNSNYKMPEKKPNDFAFILKYGIEAKNKIDTFNSKYSKDMISEEAKEINLKFSDEEMDEIYSIMKDIDIMSYPNIFKPKGTTSCKPFEEFYIRILIDEKEKIIEWSDYNKSQTDEAVKLRNLFRKIHEFISKKEEYKSLPNPKDSYM